MFIGNDPKKVSFGKIIYDSDASAASVFKDYLAKRQQEQAQIRARQKQFLDAQSNMAVVTQLQGLFGRSNQLMEYYNAEADKAIRSYSRSTVTYVYKDWYHGLGDNCYEFAMKDMLDQYGYPLDSVRNPGFTIPKALPDIFVPGEIEKLLLTYISTDVYNITRGAHKIQAIWDGNANAVPSGFDKCCIWGMTPVGFDYHFFRKDPETGYWLQKCGAGSVTCFDAAGMLITNPMTAKNIYQKSYPVGYFRIK